MRKVIKALLVKPKNKLLAAIRKSKMDTVQINLIRIPMFLDHLNQNIPTRKLTILVLVQIAQKSLICKKRDSKKIA
ncbi:hypothetical protein CTV99_18770 [Bacillus pumilus]|uniref:Uncharacterized protein n=1 Tax=Bacillus pumilus TaxID=1408 RepID=A0A2G8IP38_BACPU|nr:hypothetical protein CTV99_18770 [Bacillus pumilus]